MTATCLGDSFRLGKTSRLGSAPSKWHRPGARGSLCLVEKAVWLAGRMVELGHWLSAKSQRGGRGEESVHASPEYADPLDGWHMRSNATRKEVAVSMHVHARKGREMKGRHLA